MIDKPTPKLIKSSRLAMGYTQKEAAALVHVSLRAWQLWEAGDRKMPAAAWELCVIKCEMHPKFVPRKSH